jgi:hypothetical protein
MAFPLGQSQAATYDDLNSEPLPDVRVSLQPSCLREALRLLGD